jgi:NTP pyrophosphatase (non-canonical NTP hydrolase)
MTFNYIEEAHQTLADGIHTDKVTPSVLYDALWNFQAAAQRLDDVKKALFYGRDNLVGQTASSEPPEPNFFNTNIIHGIIGIATESGELVEALFKAMFNGEEFDVVNMCEEIGDCRWYEAILAKIGGVTFDQIERNNIDKLRARFPNKFTEYDANNRDLGSERAILETVFDAASGD